MKLKFKIFVHSLFEKAEKVFRRFGLAVSRVRSRRIDSRLLTEGRSIIYHTGLDPVMTSLELSKARILSYPLVGDAHSHVNVFLLRKALNSPDKNNRYNIIQSGLVDYSEYNSQNRDFLSDALGLNRVHLPDSEDMPPWYIIYPWSNITDHKTKIRQSNRSTLVENVKRGGPALTAEQGGAQHYLVSRERAEFEAELLYKLLLSVEKKGYAPDPGNFDPIGAVLLITSDEEWCWMVSGGIHRCCVFSALKQEEVDVSIKKAVYREDVSDWPNVKSGYFTKEEALYIFDNIMSENSNSHHVEWTKRFSQ